jgi:hypothetical protein
LAALAKEFSQFVVELDNGISPTARLYLILWIVQCVAGITSQFVKQVKF